MKYKESNLKKVVYAQNITASVNGIQRAGEKICSLAVFYITFRRSECVYLSLKPKKY